MWEASLTPIRSTSCTVIGLREASHSSTRRQPIISTMPVRTRFAPSPTGYLHIGGVRTALFNWLFAKGQGGQFILRIDDTDAQRNVEEALAPILHGLKWVGLDWDEGPGKGGPHEPYFQSMRQDRYQVAVDRLLEVKAAYRDYARPHELQELREKAELAGKAFVYKGDFRPKSDAEEAGYKQEGRESVVRLSMPRQGQFVLNDLVRGEVCIDWATEQDHVIQRADGSCLYHLATVVDDYEMRISHVIRAEEHLSNTPRQAFIFEKLGHKLPQFAHVPFVAEPGSKTKLSKRKLNKYLKDPQFRSLYAHGHEIAAWLDQYFKRFVATREIEDTAEFRRRYTDALRAQLPVNIPILSDDPNEQAEIVETLRNRALDIFANQKLVELYELGTLIGALGITLDPETFNPLIVNFYERVGYLPHAILNYLLLLGWSLDDKTEYFSREDMIRFFSLERVNKSAASFDPEKLLAFQAKEMQRISTDQKIQFVKEYFVRALGWEGIVAPDDLDTDFSTYIERIVRAAGDRIKVAGDILTYSEFFVSEQTFKFEEAAFEKRIRNPPHAIGLLQRYRTVLANAESFAPDALEQLTKEFVNTEGIKLGDIVHSVRVAVTGRTVGLGLFDTLSIIGRSRSLARINHALEIAAGERKLNSGTD
jgi:glutamyl/glutaminyl-tRNA synthetase